MGKAAVSCAGERPITVAVVTGAAARSKPGAKKCSAKLLVDSAGHFRATSIPASIAPSSRSPN